MALHSEALLRYLAGRARGHFRLTVWQWKPGRVGAHSSGSLHYATFSDGIGKAFDAFGTTLRMGRYARACRKYHGQSLTELIHNSPVPGLSASIKYGRKVPPSFWGSETWQMHRNHVHVGNL